MSLIPLSLPAYHSTRLKTSIPRLILKLGSKMLPPTDLNSTLSLLRNELPDPNQELFRSDFPLFRKLPVELRLKIWRFTFPRERRINVWLGPQRILCVHFPGCLISGSVNRESRAETLKHYHNIHQTGLGRRYHGVQQSCLIRRRTPDFQIEGLFECVLSRDVRENSIHVDDWSSPIGWRFCELFDSLFTNATRDFFPFVGILRVMLNLREILPFTLEGWLEKFIQLLEIRLTEITPRWKGYMRKNSSYPLKDIKNCKLTVENFYERHPKYSTPKITILPRASNRLIASPEA